MYSFIWTLALSITLRTYSWLVTNDAIHFVKISSPPINRAFSCFQICHRQTHTPTHLLSATCCWTFLLNTLWISDQHAGSLTFYHLRYSNINTSPACELHMRHLSFVAITHKRNSVLNFPCLLTPNNRCSTWFLPCTGCACVLHYVVDLERKLLIFWVLGSAFHRAITTLAFSFFFSYMFWRHFVMRACFTLYLTMPFSTRKVFPVLIPSF